MAGYLENKGRYYVVSLLGDKYHTHRLVYYMRTGCDPGNADVFPADGGSRTRFPGEMVLIQRQAAKPRTRRNRRRSDWY